MTATRTLWCFLVASAFVLCQSQDEYTDENRPYKFGFNIEGYQHRKEEKDERGIIMGEFGFITADGYYRVTVYATDENGDFRIISMKNIYVGFPPEDPTTTPLPSSQFDDGPIRKQTLRTGNSPITNEAYVQRPDPVPTSSRRKKPVPAIGQSACSDCLIPTTRKPPENEHFGIPQRSVGFRNQGPVNLRGKNRNGENNIGEQFDVRRRGNKISGTGPSRGAGGPRIPKLGEVPNSGSKSENSGLRRNNQANRKSGNTSGSGLNAPQLGDNAEYQTVPREGNIKGRGPAHRGGHFGERYEPLRSNQPSGRRRLNGRQRSQFPNNFSQTQGANGGGTASFAPENEFDLYSGNHFGGFGRERDGLPRGVTVDDVKALLYRFNYTVGFHGHHEDGYRNGDKEGDYFFDGRDGVERKVEYLANEFGYQPNITFVDLADNDPRRPNENTEKEFGLKGYEFKWFYRK